LPEDWQLILAGSEGYEAAETLEAIDQSPCKQRIHVTGYITESALAQWYAKARIFAFPSLDEGFGMPVLEAMAAGIPVITSDRSSLPEVAGTAALLVNPLKDNELEAAMNTLASNEILRTQLIEAGLERARLFSWNRAVEQTAQIYREIGSELA
jgi:glycosyltransferase involved in cell wall biosynthesis